MIVRLNEENRAEFLRRCQGAPGLGPLLTVNSALFGHQDALLQLYLCDGGALQLKGEEAVLIGEADPEELASLLAFLGITALRCDRALSLPGWQEAEPAWVMEWKPGSPQPPMPGGVVLQPQPPMSHILAVLAGEGITGPAADNFYSEACTKRNHGAGLYWTAEENGVPIAAACATAVTETEGYLSEIATLPQARGRGVGRALCAALARKLADEGRTVTLLCGESRRGFYESFGFAARRQYPALRRA